MKRIAYSGLNEDTFTPITAGQTIETEIDLAELYDVSTATYDNLAEGAPPYAEIGSTELTGQALSFLSNKISVDVDGEAAAKVAISIDTIASKRTALSTDCSGTQRTAVSTALRNCASLANAAAVAAASGSATRFQVSVDDVACFHALECVDVVAVVDSLDSSIADS